MGRGIKGGSWRKRRGEMEGRKDWGGVDGEVERKTDGRRKGVESQKEIGWEVGGGGINSTDLY